MIQQIEIQKDKMKNMQQLEESYLIDREKLYSLFERGIIDESGAPVIKNKESEMKF